jgi:chorismate synthase
MLKFLTAGESHGPCLTAIVEGLPAGLPLDLEKINQEMARRQEGFGRGGRMKIERDQAEVLSGVRFGETLGSPITLRIVNADWVNWETKMSAFGEKTGPQVTAPRPGHADLGGCQKYDRTDVRDILERASARETAARVAVGALCRQFLAKCGVEVKSRVVSIGGATETALQEQLIETARTAGDTLGGCLEVVATGVVPGLGSHIQWDRRLDAKIAAAIVSIPAIKGVEFGAGFRSGELPGSQVHDEIFYDSERGYYRNTNRAGGIEGGMSNGEPIVLRAVMKPIPTLTRSLASVDIQSHEAVKANSERSDVCAVQAASLVAESMLCLVLAGAVLDKFAGDSMEQLLFSLSHYRQKIR